VSHDDLQSWPSCEYDGAWGGTVVVIICETHALYWGGGASKSSLSAICLLHNIHPCTHKLVSLQLYIKMTSLPIYVIYRYNQLMCDVIVTSIWRHSQSTVKVMEKDEKFFEIGKMQPWSLKYVRKIKREL